MLGPITNIERVSGSTLRGLIHSVLPARPTKGVNVAYPRKLEHTSISGAAPNPPHPTLNSQLTSKPLENRKKSAGEGHQKPVTNPSHERESRDVQPLPHFRGVSVVRPIDTAKEAHRHG